MNEAVPGIEQLTLWRTVLDALGQLSSAWETVHSSVEQTGEPLEVPEEVAAALARAGTRGAEALSGVAEALAASAGGAAFADLADDQQRTRDGWQRATHGLTGDGQE
ncbi:hypothetical protein [Saccharopolyspora cebuensis]|uniref:Excreted virulence factor EspC, type VII ESX diderm n=1 Tax=Saccharopolyspora cebuensis TaxID=418759 RepID=A0ABV4CJG0_9PSEU